MRYARDDEQEHQLVLQNITSDYRFNTLCRRADAQLSGVARNVQSTTPASQWRHPLSWYKPTQQPRIFCSKKFLDESPFFSLYIEDEFNETFGYVRQDIRAVLQKDLRLHYTIALLVCCACEMLAWHHGRDQHQIFIALLPDTEHYKTIGKTLWEALRHGLAHNFRPHTIEIGKDRYRFSISSGPNPAVTVTPGDPHWINLNIRALSMNVISRIDSYEQELRASAEARDRFQNASRRTTKPVSQDAVKITQAFKAITSEAALGTS